MGYDTAEKKPINLHWGKPAPTLLPTQDLSIAAQATFSDTVASTADLQYGDPMGYQPLRENLSSWLSGIYGSPDNPDHICITGGASQGLAVILQVLTDPLITKAVWMVAPCFHMACRIFEDAGLTDKLRGVEEDDDGAIDLEYLEREMARVNSQESTKLVSLHLIKPRTPWRRFSKL